MEISVRGSVGNHYLSLIKGDPKSGGSSFHPKAQNLYLVIHRIEYHRIRVALTSSNFQVHVVNEI